MATGIVLGLTMSLGGTVLAGREVQHDVGTHAGLSPENLRLLTEVVERVRDEYVNPVDERRIVENAIRGILGELDKHSRYLAPGDYEDVRISTTGNYSGVGIDVNVEEGKVVVIAPLEGSPAARAGILPGDVVVAVDGVPVDPENLEATVGRMRGEAGTSVTLDVARHGAAAPLEFTLTRADIHVNTVRSELLDDGFGYLRLTSFSNTTAKDLESAAIELRRDAGEELKGLVLDLRNNPGGVLEAAIDVSDLFLRQGLIVRGNGRARKATFERYADEGDVLEKVPLVVLVNGGSASASEIVAGALKDHGRARLVGTRTYGKGSVQTVMPLGQGSAIKLTTSLYVTPSGHSINGIGIEPDVTVENDDPKRRYRGPDGTTTMLEDRQLREALRLIGFTGLDIPAQPVTASRAD
ncbi:MAG TPA: S41 family peptidase [Gammaproteobacteria bacterium]